MVGAAALAGLAVSVVARLVPVTDLDQATLAEWTALGQRCRYRPNPFAMPAFVLPAARWLTPNRIPAILLVEKFGQGDRRIVGAGCFLIESANWFVPVPHLAEYCTRHSFRGGMLYEDDQAAAVAGAVVEFLSGPAVQSHVHALSLRNVLADCPLLQALQACGSKRLRWFERSRTLRPVLRLAPGLDPMTRLKPSACKDLGRRRRRLQERAPYDVRILLNPPPSCGSAESHLALERDGWKGAAGSAMSCSSAETGFFRELAARHGALGEEAGLVFSEILSDGKVVASSSNFLLGDSVSAFKTGWRSDYSAFSPGRLNELELCSRLPQLMPQVSTFDSLSKADSYMGQLLTDREAICSGALALGRIGGAAMRMARIVRPVAYWRSRSQPLDEASPRTGTRPMQCSGGATAFRPDSATRHAFPDESR